jgi:hypothetical protein
MSQAPAKGREGRKEEKDNIFLEILYNVLVQLPVMVIVWIISQFNSD